MNREIVNPGIKYFIVSLKHTHKRDKYITLWRHKNAGYCWAIELAGQYEGYENNYHNSGCDEDLNVPVPVELVTEKYCTVDDLGRRCLKNSKSTLRFIKSFSTPELLNL